MFNSLFIFIYFQRQIVLSSRVVSNKLFSLIKYHRPKCIIKVVNVSTVYLSQFSQLQNDFFEKQFNSNLVSAIWINESSLPFRHYVFLWPPQVHSKLSARKQNKHSHVHTHTHTHTLRNPSSSSSSLSPSINSDLVILSISQLWKLLRQFLAHLYT